MYLVIAQDKLQSEFDQLLLRWTESWGITEDDIEDELTDAQEKMEKLRKRGRNSELLQRKIQDLKRLVELRDLLRFKVSAVHVV